MVRRCGFDDAAVYELVDDGIRLCDRNLKGGQYRRREVSDVKGHDHVGDTGQSGRKNVAIILVR